MRKVKIQPNKLSAKFLRNTFDESNRTIDVVFATGAPVKRFSFFDGEYIEQLSMKKASIRMDRLNNGAPVLNNHRNGELSDQIGTVVSNSAKVLKGEAIATLRLSGREEIKGIVEDIKDGIISNISVGYKIHEFKEEKKKNENDLPVYTAVDWEPLEISFVTIPADASAQARSEDKRDYDEVIITEQEDSMSKKKNSKKKPVVTEVRSEESSAAEAEEVKEEEVAAEESSEEEKSEDKSEDEAEVEGDNSAEPEEESKEDESEEEKEEDERSDEVESNNAIKTEEVRLEERNRIAEVRSLCDHHEMNDEFTKRCINEGLNEIEVRAEILEAMEKKSEDVKTFNHNLEVNDVDNKKLRNEARVRSMLHMGNGGNYELKEGDREFAGNSLIDMAREYLQTEENVKNVLSMSKTEVAKRALLHSSDFPELLANTGNKSLRDAYESVPNTFEPFTKSVTRKDFKEGSSIVIGDGGKLEGVNERGEYKRAGIDESAEKYKVEKFGKIIGHTWELMVNDDLDAFTRIPARMGVRAREKENEKMWDLITGNAGAGQLMAETGLNMFDAGHGNLGTAGVISVASISEGRAAMRLQRDLDGELIGGLSPKYLYVPAALETVADQFVSQIQANTSSDVNPFANRLQVVVEPRLDAISSTGWYLMSDKAMIDMAEIARLDGRGPEMFTREGFDVDGMEVKIRYVFNTKVIDYRGFFRNAGA